MLNNLVISIFSCIFATWIGGLSTPTDKGNPTALPLCNLLELFNVGKMKRFTKDEFVNRARKVHGDKYDYSKVVYVNASTKVKIVCPTHGVFLQRPFAHFYGQGCPNCVKDNMWTTLRHKRTTKEFIDEANKIHGSKYDYSKTDYTHSLEKVIITCPVHGDFLQYPFTHLKGQGCPSCAKSKGEKRVGAYLSKNNIEFDRQYKIDNENIFCQQKHFLVDFYLPSYNAIIEYNGIQHYLSTDYFRHKDFDKQQERDMALRQYCKEHKIKLIEIPYTDIDNIENIINKELNLK